MKAKSKKALKKRFKISASGLLLHNTTHTNHRRLNLSRSKTLPLKKSFVLSNKKQSKKIKSVI